jgi:uncharacterized membrane protein YoaK (UPF0700 family)
LSIVAGYADTTGYLSWGAFAGQMTGNTVLLGIDLFSREPLHALQKLLIIAMFLFGVGTSTVLRRVGFTLPMLLALETLALVAAAFLAASVAAPTLAFAMGIQNAAATRFSGATLNTVFLTGDLQKLAQAMVSRVGWTHPSQSAAGTGVLALAYASYLAGALFGAAAHLWVGRPLLLAALLLPVALLPVRPTTATAAGARDPR